jgi:hypothetical protein
MQCNWSKVVTVGMLSVPRYGVKIFLLLSRIFPPFLDIVIVSPGIYLRPDLDSEMEEQWKQNFPPTSSMTLDWLPPSTSKL